MLLLRLLIVILKSTVICTNINSSIFEHYDFLFKGDVSKQSRSYSPPL